MGRKGPTSPAAVERDLIEKVCFFEKVFLFHNFTKSYNSYTAKQERPDCWSVNESNSPPSSLRLPGLGLSMRESYNAMSLHWVPKRTSPYGRFIVDTSSSSFPFNGGPEIQERAKSVYGKIELPSVLDSGPTRKVTQFFHKLTLEQSLVSWSESRLRAQTNSSSCGSCQPLLPLLPLQQRHSSSSWSFSSPLPLARSSPSHSGPPPLLPVSSHWGVHRGW